MKKPTIKWVHECYSESFGVVSLAVTSCFTCLITPMIPQTTATAIPIHTYFFMLTSLERFLDEMLLLVWQIHFYIEFQKFF